jgi:opacity protein-like surface antigen
MIRPMVQIALIAASLAGLASVAACAANGPEGNPYYSIGDANYDNVKAASDDCKAKGGTFGLKKGGDPTHLGDYECVTAKGS